LAGFAASLQKLADRMRPQLVILSAGFDAHRLDPIGSLRLETEDFAALGRAVRQVADVHCQGRIVSVLEGGYHPQALAESIEAHLGAIGDAS
jgi:acetoin utilization deacetylase AcuC-like enzyme